MVVCAIFLKLTTGMMKYVMNIKMSFYLQRVMDVIVVHVKL